MPGMISANYRELEASEIAQVAADCATAWQDPNIPDRQFELAVKPELLALRRGEPCAPFGALARCLRKLPVEFMAERPRLLDIGASGGYYSEVIQRSGFQVKYTGLDFSPAFKALADKLYPGLDFDVADARALPYHDDSFDIVLNAAVIMHTAEYEDVIRETARVAKRYAIFHRTPIVPGHTRFFQKEAYGVPCLEAHFCEADLLRLFTKYGLSVIHIEDVFRQDSLTHRDYLLSKAPGLGHVQV